MCICVWNLKLCVLLNTAAVHCSALGFIGQRWSVKQPATQEFANTSCHLCDSLVDFQRPCCCGKKLSLCHVCLLDEAELLEARLSSKAGYPGGPPPFPVQPTLAKGEESFGVATHITNVRHCSLMLFMFIFSSLEIQKASLFSLLFRKNPRSKLLIRHESVISGDPQPLVGSHLARPQTGGRTHRKR